MFTSNFTAVVRTSKFVKLQGSGATEKNVVLSLTGVYTEYGQDGNGNRTETPKTVLVKVFGKQALNLHDMITDENDNPITGIKLTLVGEVRPTSYTNPATGEIEYGYELIVNMFDIMSKDEVQLMNAKKQDPQAQNITINNSNVNIEAPEVRKSKNAARKAKKLAAMQAAHAERLAAAGLK